MRLQGCRGPSRLPLGLWWRGLQRGSIPHRKLRPLLPVPSATCSTGRRRKPVTTESRGYIGSRRSFYSAVLSRSCTWCTWGEAFRQRSCSRDCAGFDPWAHGIDRNPCRVRVPFCGQGSLCSRRRRPMHKRTGCGDARRAVVAQSRIGSAAQSLHMQRLVRRYRSWHARCFAHEVARQRSR